jgi:O-antigen ligase
VEKHPLSVWQLGLLALFANVVPLAVLFFQMDGPGVDRVSNIVIISERIKLAAFVFGVTLFLLVSLWSYIQHRYRPEFSRFYLPAVGFILAFGLSFIAATDPLHALAIGTEIYLLPVCLFALISITPITNRQLLWLITLMLPAALLMTLAGMIQVYDWAEWINLLPVYSPTSVGAFLYNNNLAGEYILLLLPLVIGATLATSHWGLRTLLGGMVLLLLTYLVLSLSRGAWLGFLGSLLMSVSMVLWLTWKHRRNKPDKLDKRTDLRKTFRIAGLFASAIPLFFILLLTSNHWGPIKDLYTQEFGSIATEVKTPDHQANTGRLSMWKDSLNLLEHSPLTGLGANHYPIHITRYLTRPESKVAWNDKTAQFQYPHRPHNDYLQIWIELGPLGLISLISLFVLISWTAWQGTTRLIASADHSRLALLMGCFASFVGFSIIMVFQFPFRMGTTAFFGWLAAGLIVTLSRAQPVAIRPFAQRGANLWLALLIVLSSISFWYTSAVFRSNQRTFQAPYFYSLQRDLQTTEHYYQTAHQIAPWNRDPLIEFLQIQLYTGKFQTLLESSTGLLQRQPYTLPVMLYRARAWVALGNADKAVEELTPAIRTFYYIPEVKAIQKLLKHHGIHVPSPDQL